MLGSFGLFRANQYFEHLSPSFKNWAWLNLLLFLVFHFLSCLGAFEEQELLLALFLFSSVTLLEMVLLFWVSISF